MEQNKRSLFCRWGWRFCMLPAVCALSFGCATAGNVFVLVPDPDGHLGSASVSNCGGITTLARAGDSTAVKNSAKAPGKPQAMANESIQKVFGQALAAEPPQPARFLIYFEQDSAEPDSKAEGVIAEVLASIKQRDSHDISVIGHTDRSGETAYNLKLSVQRATCIRDILVKGGVNAECLDVSSHGENNPLIPTADDVMEPRNRRVEVVVR